MKQAIKYAGISVSDDGEIGLHVTGMQGRIGVFMHVPGKITYEFIKLPKAMDKLGTVKYLLKHKSFKVPKIQKFLQVQILRREHGIPATPRRERLSHYHAAHRPVQRQVRKAA